MKLTTKQQELLELGKEGYITIEDSFKIYSSEQSRKSAIKRLLILGLIREVSAGRFELN
jgi:RNA:NAD 2'-phosphotransferase (TPT1/KptA family)